MKIDLQELKRLAGEATPGPWKEANKPARTSPRRVVVLLNKQYVGVCRINAGIHDRANAQYIAACSPEVIKALVDVVEKARAVLACDDGNGANNYYSDRDYDARRDLESALTPFTESTNEEA